MTNAQPRRPLALVLSRREDRRLHACLSLKDLGYDTLGFSLVEDAEAWLEEDTPVVAVVDRTGGRGPDGVIATLRERGVPLMPTGRPWTSGSEVFAEPSPSSSRRSASG